MYGCLEVAKIRLAQPGWGTYLATSWMYVRVINVQSTMFCLHIVL